MRGKLLKEEKRYQELLEKFNSLKNELDEMKEREKAGLEKDNEEKVKTPQKATTGITPPLSQTEVDGKTIASKSSPQPNLNGHHTPREPESPADERCKEVGSADNGIVLPGGSGALQCLSPSSPASSSLSSSPCSSPVLTKRLASIGCSSPTYPSSYQASINQRFQAARTSFSCNLRQSTNTEHPLSTRLETSLLLRLLLLLQTILLQSRLPATLSLRCCHGSQANKQQVNSLRPTAHPLALITATWPQHPHRQGRVQGFFHQGSAHQ